MVSNSVSGLDFFSDNNAESVVKVVKRYIAAAGRGGSGALCIELLLSAVFGISMLVVSPDYGRQSALGSDSLVVFASLLQFREISATRILAMGQFVLLFFPLSFFPFSLFFRWDSFCMSVLKSISLTSYSRYRFGCMTL